MKAQKMVIGIWLFLLGNSFFAHSQDRDQLTIPLSNPGKEGKLEVSIITGSIKVIGYAGKEIMIEAVEMNKNEEKNSTMHTKTNSNTKNGSRNTEGMRKISSNDGFEITAKEKGNVVDVSIDRVNIGVNMTIKVPQKFSLKLSTINNGNISVENVTGNLEISNINGFIKLKNVGGSVLANTLNEDIIVNFTEVTPDTPMAFTTLNGNVDVTFPANFKSNVKVKTDRGDIFSDFDIEIDKTTSKIQSISEKEKGLYKIKKDDWTSGKINGGGSETRIKTMNGDIFIRKIK